LTGSQKVGGSNPPVSTKFCSRKPLNNLLFKGFPGVGPKLAKKFQAVSKSLLERPLIPWLLLALESMLPHRHIIISFQHNAVFVKVMGKIDIPFVIERRFASKLRNN
jgi:hypothetical protein